MLKIAMFGHKHVFTTEGGIEVVVSELVRRMSKTEKVVVYDRYELDKKPEVIVDPEADYSNLTVKHSPTFSKSAVNAQMASFFSTISCAFSDADIVHVHAEGPCVFLPLLKLFRKKVVVTIHGIDWQRAKWGKFARWYIHLGEKMAAKYADKIIVLSSDAYRYFVRTYGKFPVIIRNGVTVTPTEETNEIEKFGLKPYEYVLFLGRFAPEKRMDLLYDAYDRGTEIPNLVFAGPEKDLNRDSVWYQAATKDGRVVFTGHVDGALKDQLFSNCATFVLPSDLEGMSVSLLEALAYGCSVIVSDIQENKDILHGFGKTFEAGNADALYEKLKTEKPAPNPRKDEQIKYFAENYNWDHVVEETLLLYQRI